MKVNQFAPWVGAEEYQAIADCFESNWITEGPKSKAFSAQLLDLIGAKYGVFAPNGTLALYLGLKAMDIGPGDEVIVPDFTFIASATSVHMAGATPVFVEVNRDNFQIELSHADHLVNDKTKAIMPVHIYGTIADMDAVAQFAKKHNLLVIEDAAAALGVHYKGQHAGTFGDIGTFSFFADKTITTGEGGFVVTSNEEMHHKLLLLRNQGRVDRGSFIHPEMGYNFRITDIQAAIGQVQLAKLPQIIARKEAIKQYYLERLGQIEEISFLTPAPEAEWVPFRVAIFADNAQAIRDFMKEKGVEPRSLFYPLHKQPCFAYLKETNPQNMKSENFPNSIYAYENGMSLPSFPALTEEQMAYVCSVIEAYYGK